jgi:hypothetical protein
LQTSKRSVVSKQQIIRDLSGDALQHAGAPGDSRDP